MRARAGYTLGAFLPFVTGGLALTQYELTNSARVSGRQERRDGAGNIIESIPFDSGQLGGTSSGIALGLAAGAGVDVALTQNVFLRGEWQYVFFPDVGGIETSINTWRGAAGVKF
ncbi:MAG: outer membrane protein [Salinarimonas sp.]